MIKKMKKLPKRSCSGFHENSRRKIRDARDAKRNRRELINY